MDQINWSLLEAYFGNNGNYQEQTRCHDQDVGWGGSDELLTTMSRVFEGQRPDWLEEEVCPGGTDPYITRQEFASQKETHEPQSNPVQSTASVQRMRLQQDDRRCGRGECCGPLLY